MKGSDFYQIQIMKSRCQTFKHEIKVPSSSPIKVESRQQTENEDLDVKRYNKLSCVFLNGEFLLFRMASSSFLLWRINTTLK